MNYLTYEEYLQMGGVLDEAAFNTAERRARQLINAQCGGLTGERIERLSELPQAVKDCAFDLIAFLGSDECGSVRVSSESRSQGGVSESISYQARTDEQTRDEADEIIYDGFFGGGLGWLLYRGAGI